MTPEQASKIANNWGCDLKFRVTSSKTVLGDPYWSDGTQIGRVYASMDNATMCMITRIKERARWMVKRVEDRNHPSSPKIF